MLLQLSLSQQWESETFIFNVYYLMVMSESIIVTDSLSFLGVRLVT